MKKIAAIIIALLLSGLAMAQDPAIHVTEEGNVAIGGWNAAARLHVLGGGILTDSYIGFSGAPVNIPTEGSFLATEVSRGNLVLYQAGAPRLTIGSFGDESFLGIGAGSGQQNYPLHIKGNRSLNPLVKLESKSTGTFIEYRTNDNPAGKTSIWFAGINGAYPGRFWFGTPEFGGTTVFFDQSGYNGFNVAEPEAVLHIAQKKWDAKDGFRISNGSSILNIYGKPAGEFHIDATTPLVLNSSGSYVRIGDDILPSFPLHMSSGAHVTVGGVWTDASSRDLKENIRDLTIDEALTALTLLSPKKYNYRVDKEEEYLGFIAEDVPGIVATNDKKSLSPMDIVALLTKIVQQQQQKLEELEEKITSLKD